jgi:protein SCO1/2
VRFSRRVFVVALAFGLATCVAVLDGCHGGEKSASLAGKQYPIRGSVVSVDQARGEILLNHLAVPGVMEAMTMSYPVADPSALTELHAGDLISAALTMQEDAAGPKNLRLKDIVVVGEANLNIKPLVQFHLPASGDVVPDFKLLNQSGRRIDLKQYRGKVVVMTFIYTRCPLADYCPRMSHNFAQIDKALASNKDLYAKTHLLSVSFDPTYDTPKVLKSYGAAYTGKYVNETFDHWEFAAPPVEELPKMMQFFDVGVTPGVGGTLQHSLSTVVIGKDGKVVAFWPTNDWAVQDVMAKIQESTN